MEQETINSLLKTLEDGMKREIDTRIQWMKDEFMAFEAVKTLRQGATYDPMPDYRVGRFGSIRGDIKLTEAKRIKDYLRGFAKKGWRQSTSNVKETEKPYWVLKHPDYPGVDFAFQVSFADNDESACHMEQVGVETIEVPVMKLVCPDGQPDLEFPE